MEEVRALACGLSSSHIAEAHECQVQLTRFLAPERLVKMWQEGQQDMAVLLLSEAESIGSPDVYAALGKVFKCLFDPGAGRAVAEQFLRLDTTHIVPKFLIKGISHEDISIPGSLLPALLALLGVIPSDLAPGIGELLCTMLKNERVLRLFDEANADSKDNVTVYTFLSCYTDLISFIWSSTIDAFENDPLLVANYLVVSGIISRQEEISHVLFEKLRGSLMVPDNEFVFCFVCRACAVTLHHHERNASKFAAAWVTAAAQHLTDCSPEVRDAIYDLLGAASTTAAGWSTAQLFVQKDEMTRSFGVAAVRVSLLDFMGVLVQSPHVEDSLFIGQPLLAAWELRNNPDDMVREKFWCFVNYALGRETLAVILVHLCTSFLSSMQHDASVTVRELQRQATTHIVNSNLLTENAKEQLTKSLSRGLYPSGSAGIEAMSQH